MSPKRILVVDDEVVIVNLLSYVLKANGYDVLTASDGSEAVSSARLQKPDLILLDVTFPPDVAHGGGLAWNAVTIIDWLRRMDEAKDIPIIVMSTREAVKDKERVLAKGIAGCIQKPIDNNELLSVVRNTLGEPSPEPGGAGT